MASNLCTFLLSLLLLASISFAQVEISFPKCSFGAADPATGQPCIIHQGHYGYEKEVRSSSQSHHPLLC